MRVLLIKTSSMGDIIHTLPALTDAANAIPGIKFDWVVEDSFVEIPRWHPNVDKVIPIGLRRWRKAIFSSQTRSEWRQLRQTLKEQQYDIILDAQGLVKSSFLAFFAKGTRTGLNWRSARESLASLAYQKTCEVNFYQHAIVRMRSLFSQALNYPLPMTEPVFGLKIPPLTEAPQKYLVFLHATTWVTKLWPEKYWLQLAKTAAEAGYRIKMGGGNAEEVARAERIASQCDAIDLVPYLSIGEMAKLLAYAKGAVAVDTGFGHLAGALDIPLVSIYGSTNPEYTGALGKQSVHLAAKFSCSPCLSRLCTFQGESDVSPACYATLPPSLVWGTLGKML